MLPVIVTAVNIEWLLDNLNQAGIINAVVGAECFCQTNIKQAPLVREKPRKLILPALRDCPGISRRCGAAAADQFC